MSKRTVKALEAGNLVAEWADKALRPLCTPAGAPLDFSLEPTCDKTLLAIADNLDGDLSVLPKPLLQLAWARALWAAAAGMLEPDTPIVTIPAGTPAGQLLAYLIGGVLANTRLPPEWHDEAQRQLSAAASPGSARRQ